MSSLLRALFWIVLALLLVVHLVGGWLFSSDLIHDAFVPNPDPITVPTGDYELEVVQYDTELGPMDAWYLPADGDIWVIHVHGKGVTPAEAEPMFAPLQEAGYPQLAITYRNDDGQPEDPSGYYQYGATEYEDVAAAVDYALDHGAEKIFFNSYSTGAAHTLGFVFREVRDRVIGAHFDSPNLDFGTTVSYNAAQRDLPLLPISVPPTMSAVAKFITSLRIGVSWQSLDYVEKSESSLLIPVLVHHGLDDKTVPIESSREFASLNTSLVRLIEVPGADHVGSYDVLGQEYVDEVLTFLRSLS